ncbi:Sec-independent protein translocase subunit TatA/TatB [Roseimaritima ulvae]|uniref:Twin arginine translocase protein A n=1 Tax=Roseimaritima ulvae TaxID=980254 RepID=A0A5B9QIR5_9BACT|nr:twin-arginine translocase TatA/TatE family subunit [Roseimaritima ulvae]QEG38794.1 twin arginine translocase protein A [Roseimaritima ulvae]
MFGLSFFELMVIGVVAVLLFGAKLPEVARTLGGSYRDLKRGMNDIQNQFRLAELEVTRPKPVVQEEEEEGDGFGPAAVSSAPKFSPPPADD